ncbi:MAG: caspase family protein [Gemmobacter sp.]|nr:caspase family protein [Gemmobacter sp.]
MLRLIVCLVLLLPGAVQAADRVALVVGMGGYETVVKLDNTTRDALGISDTLKGIGFEVTTLVDVPGTDLRRALDDFAFRAETAELALIYFAGHGVEVQGENFLIPVDAKVTSNRDIQRQAISLTELLAAVDGARKMRIVILDSCRDNPFGDLIDAAETRTQSDAAATTRSAGRGGLAPASPDRGTLVAFAARDGEKALDGTGANSPFAEALMANLPRKGLEISLLFRQVRDDVLSATGNLQEPHTYGSLSGTPFYLAGPDGDSTIGAENLRVAWSDIRPDQETRLASLAQAGDTRSMVGLAYIRLNGDDSRYDPVAAAQLLEKAAAAGSAEAQFELAQLLEMGLGVPQDVPRAIALYLAAAKQEFPDALNDLGFMHFQGGMGVPQDQAKALDYFERAARQRHPEAMYNYAALIDDKLVPGRGPEQAGELLYRALRSGNKAVFEQLTTKPTMFTAETRKALQRRLSENNLYAGAIDGAFGPGTQRSIRAAYGLAE